MAEEAPRKYKRHIVRKHGDPSFEKSFPELKEMADKGDKEGVHQWFKESNITWNDHTILPLTLVPEIIEESKHNGGNFMKAQAKVGRAYHHQIN